MDNLVLVFGSSTSTLLCVAHTMPLQMWCCCSVCPCTASTSKHRNRLHHTREIWALKTEGRKEKKEMKWDERKKRRRREGRASTQSSSQHTDEKLGSENWGKGRWKTKKKERRVKERKGKERDKEKNMKRKGLRKGEEGGKSKYFTTHRREIWTLKTDGKEGKVRRMKQKGRRGKWEQERKEGRRNKKSFGEIEDGE